MTELEALNRIKSIVIQQKDSKEILDVIDERMKEINRCEEELIESLSECLWIGLDS